MAFLRNLEERFNEKVEELYGRIEFAKDSADLHPIIIVRPDDPNRIQGTEASSRLIPIRRIAIDERRIGAFLSSPQGIRFLLNQQLLQTGNAISETRILNPLFINLNLTPNEHFDRQLTDQTKISLGSIERSPASTPEIGIAGRLQKSTSATATSRITGRNYGRSVIGLLGSTQLVQSLLGTIGIGEQFGTLGINERPELMIKVGRVDQFYSVLLRKGFSFRAQRELDILAGALGAAGAVGSTFGLPNIFSGLGGGSPNPIPAQTEQMKYGITSDVDADRYLASSIKIGDPVIVTPISASRVVNLLQAGVFASAIAGSATIRRIATGIAAATRNVTTLFSASTQKISRTPSLNVSDTVLDFRTDKVVAEDIRDGGAEPLQDRFDRYEKDGRSEVIKDALKKQADLIKKYTEKINTNEVPKRGIIGGITLEKLQSLNAEREAGQEPISDYRSAQAYFDGLDERPLQPGSDKGGRGYYHDTLNLVTRLRKTDGTMPLTDEVGVTYPQDYINVTIYDKTNDRLEPFRAILAGITETVTPNFNETPYIGRIERNIIYTGATRQLGFTLYVNAWSAIELQSIWDKVNFITGLAFPSGVSSDGYLLPPIVELTLGDFYKAQPGYFTGITHTIEDDASWEIERLDNDESKSAQVPKTVQMQLSFTVIEKESMVSSSPFYGFGVPLTA